MEFANASVPGVVPDYGAIFMSNSETRIESFKRKIFGLPYSLSFFIKQVKPGMVLFLFDSDTRHLYGVFQAVSNGTTSIVHHAHSSSGRRFPAQVQFTTIWECDPLPESEFRECIKDNYFSAKEFKFGLSEHQVQSLLHLFSQRKLKLSMSPRHLTRSGMAERPRTTSSKAGVVVDQHKLVLNDNFANLKYNDVGLYSSDFTGKDRRKTDDDIFPTRFMMGSERHHVENDTNQSMLRENHRNALINENILRDDERVSASYAFENKGYTSNDYDPIISSVNSRNIYGEASRPAADHSFMRSTKNTLHPINSREHTSNLFYEGNSAAATHNLVTNMNHDFDSINSRDNPRSLFGEGISVVADHSLTRNVINDFDPVNSRDRPQNLYRDRSSDTPDPSFIRNYMTENTCNLGNEDYYGNSSSGNKVRRAAYDEKFSRSSMLPYKDNLDHGFNTGINSTYSLGTLKKIAEDERLIFSREDEYNPDNGQFVQPSSRSLDPRMSNQPHLSFKGDPVRSSPVGYDPDSPNIHFDSSSSFLADRNSNYLNKHLHADIKNMPKIYSLSQNQPFQHQMQQPKYLNSQLEVKNSSSARCISGIPPSTAGYPDTAKVCSGDYEASNGLHASEFSLSAPSAIRKTEIQYLNNEGPHLTTPYRKASLLNEKQHLAVLNEEHTNKRPRRESNVFDVCSPNSSCSLGSTQRNCIEDRCYDYNSKPCRELKGVDYDIPKKRNSVFERLTVAHKVKKQPKDINSRSDQDGVDVSVNEIMGMLRRGHGHWTKADKKTVPVENLTKKKCLRFSNKKECSKSKTIIDHSSDDEVNAVLDLVPILVPVYQDKPIANFKRRSQLREKAKQSLISDPIDDAMKIQPKKRKLIRPDFGKTGSSQNTDINNRDKTNSATPEPNFATDALPQNKPMKRKLVRRDLVKTDSPHEKDGSNDNHNSEKITSASSEHRTDTEPKNCEENVVKEDIDKNVSSVCETIPE